MLINYLDTVENHSTALLSIQVVGPFKATASDGTVVTPKSRKARALLGILVLSPADGVSRNRLASLLWDRVEPDQARSLLRGAVHEIRACIDRGEDSALEATRDTLTLKRDRVRIDVDQIFEAGAPAMAEDIAERSLLEGLENLTRPFDDWLAAIRTNFQERLRAHLSAAPIPPTDASSVLLQGRTGIRIGVAPLRSFGGDQSDPIALVLADEISAALSRFRWLSVPSPHSVTAALGPNRDLRAACTELELDFLLDGQVQVMAGVVRLRASLVSARETSIVWTFKADRDSPDLLSFQDEIAAEVAARIDSLILTTESQRVANTNLTSHNAYNLVMRAIQIACRLDPVTFPTAGDLLERALQLEGNRPMAHISAALFHLIAASQGWLGDPRDAMIRAEREANTALSMDPSEAQAWAIAGFVRSSLYQQPEEAQGMLRRAIDMNPNLPLAWHFSTGNFLLLGDLPEARACIERYVKLGPTGVHFFGNSALISLCLLEGRYDEAVRVGRTTIAMHGNFVAAYKPFVAALGHLGLREEASQAYARLQRLEPGFDPQTFLLTSAFRRNEDRDRYAAGFRLAAP